MKTIKTLLLLLAMLVCSIGNAQTTEVDVMTATGTSGYVPAYMNYNNSYSQSIYTPTEVTTTGTITGISWEIPSATAADWTVYIELYLGENSINAFGVNSSFLPVESLTLVYAGNVTFTSGWTHIDFATPFEYLGANNLIVATLKTNTAYSSRSFSIAAVTDTTSICKYSDTQGAITTSTAVEGSCSRLKNKPIMKLSFTEGEFCPGMANLTASGTTSTSTTLSWNGDDESTVSYTVEYKTLDDEEWVVADANVVDTTYELSNLTSNTEYLARVKRNCASSESNYAQISIRTDCDPIDIDIETPYTQDFENVATSSIPECWNKLNPYNNYPYVSTSSGAAVASGTKRLEFRASSEASPSYAILPAINNDLSTIRLKFATRPEGASSGYLTIGYMTDATDTSTFVPVQTFYTNEWTSGYVYDTKIVYFTDVDASAIIAMRYHATNSSWYWFVDDVTIEIIPDCAEPSSLNTVEVTSNSATLSWNEQDGNLTLYYKEASAEEYETIENVTLTDGEYILSELNPITDYVWTLGLDCNGTQLMSLEVKSFRTPCAEYTIDEVAFVEDFENVATSSIPECWDKLNPYSSYPYVSTGSGTTVASGTKRLEFHAPSETNPSYIILPQFTNDLSTIRLNFKTRPEGSSSGYLTVGYITDITDASTFVPVQTFYTNEWTSGYVYDTKIVYFTDVDASARIAMRYHATNSVWYWYVDDVTVEFIPDCVEPANLTSENITQTSADLSWFTTDENATYRVYYRTSEATEWDSIESVSLAETYTLENLQHSTKYFWTVGIECGDEVVMSFETKEFITLCDYPEVPFTMGFENYANLAEIPCWNFYTDYSTYPSLSTTSFEGSKSLYFYGSSTVLRNYIISLPQTDPTTNPINTLQVVGMARPSNTVAQLIIGTIDEGDTTSFTALDTIAFANAGEWQRFSYPFNNYDGEQTNIAIKVYINGGYYMYLDNIMVEEIPDCPGPDSLKAVNCTTSSIDLSWQIDEQYTDFIVYYKNLTTEEESSTAATLTDGVFTLTGLETATFYEIQVATNCSGTEIMSYDAIIASTGFETATPLPYTSTFDQDDEWLFNNENSANKWYIGTIPSDTENTYLYISGSDGADTGYVNSVASVSYAYKAFEMGSTDSLIVSFDITVGGESSFDYVKVYLIPETDLYMLQTTTDPYAVISTNSYTNHAARFTQNSTYPTICNLTAPHTNIQSTLGNPSIDGHGVLVFVWHNDGSIGAGGPVISNISLSELNCPAPTFTLDNITTNSVELTFSGSAGDYSYKYKKAGETEWSEDFPATDGLVTVSDLESSSNYELMAWANCNGETSIAYTMSFRTLCGISSIPFAENFDNTTNWPSASSLTTARNALTTNCWNVQSLSTTYPYFSTTSYNTGKSFYTYGTTSYLILPAFDYEENPLTSLRVQLQARPGTTAMVAEIGVMTDVTDPTTFTSYASFTNMTASTWNMIYADFAEYTGEAGYITIKSSGTSSLYLDEINVYPTPSCLEPTDLSFSNVTESSVDIAWEGPEDATYRIYYKTAVATEYDSIENVSINGSYTLVGLEPTTTYNIYVGTECDDGSVSNSYSSLTVATNMVPVELPYETTFGANDDIAWSLNNGTLANYWTMGTVSDAGTISDALYITNDGTTPGYAVTSQSVVTAEKAFNLSNADSVHIEFDCKIGGESSYDYLKVFFAPMSEEYPAAASSTTYSAYSYSTYAVSFADVMSQSTTTTTAAGYVYKYNLTTGVVHISVNMPNPAPNAVGKLVFLWRNDTSSGTQPGAIISNVSISELGGETPVVVPPTVSTLAATEVTMTSATLNGTVVAGTETITAQGFEYKEATAATFTTVSAEATSFTATINNLTANTSYVYKSFATTASGTVYGSEMTFTTLADTTSGGGEEPCQPTTSAITETICQGESFDFNGTSYTTAGTYTATLVNAAGCDSVITLTLVVNPVTTSAPELVSICSGETYEWNGVTYNAAGTYTDTLTNAAGCDSIITLTLTVNVAEDTYDTVTVNAGETYEWNGETYTAEEGTYTAELADENGCAYTATLVVIVTEGLNDAENMINITLYPNPTTSNATLTVEGLNEEATIMLTDVQGRTIANTKLAQGQTTTTIETSDLTSGVYYIRLITSTTTRTEKLIKK